MRYAGVPLAAIVAQESPARPTVPHVFAKIVNAILDHGVRTPHICSNDGNLTQVHDLRKRILAPDFALGADVPALVLGTLLKTLLKDLRPRLLAERSSMPFAKINMAANATQQAAAFVAGLDPAVRPTLELLFFLFHVITANRHANAVSADDIARNVTPAFVETATPALQSAVSCMIKHFHRVFAVRRCRP
mgnify:CR=1 FL=1